MAEIRKKTCTLLLPILNLKIPLSVNFNIKNKSVIRKIGFKEFDYSLAGVYGNEEWKKLAEFDKVIAEQFENAIMRNDKSNHSRTQCMTKNSNELDINMLCYNC